MSRRCGTVWLVLAVALLAACRRTHDRREIRIAAGSRLAILADLQRDTSWPGPVGPELDNEAARSRIVQDVARRKPGLVAIAGDLVGDGSSPRHWSDFDALIRPLRDERIPLIAAIGNHEYWRNGRENLKFFFGRFSNLSQNHWYRVAYGPLVLVVLDSNQAALATSAWQEQTAWFARTLGELDGDAAVKGALVLLHHPPYTNSTITGDEIQVQTAFVPAFRQSTKAMAMISGHVHSYEHYVRSGKTFIVSGGGGIPRAPLLMGDRRRHPDDLYSGPEVRTFHYLDLTLTPDGIDVQVIAVAPESVMDAFRLPWP
jgi:3',5'-cyclic AMP phosphodiesterase CpdA